MVAQERESVSIYLFASTQFPASSHFFVNQVFEVDAADGTLTEYKKEVYLYQENLAHFSILKIPDHFAGSSLCFCGESCSVSIVF